MRCRREARARVVQSCTHALRQRRRCGARLCQAVFLLSTMVAAAAAEAAVGAGIKQRFLATGDATRSTYYMTWQCGPDSYYTRPVATGTDGAAAAPSQWHGSRDDRFVGIAAVPGAGATS